MNSVSPIDARQMLADGMTWSEIAEITGETVAETQRLARPSRTARWFESCSTPDGRDKSRARNAPRSKDFADMAGIPAPGISCQGWYALPGDAGPLGYCPRCVKAAMVVLERDDPDGMPRHPAAIAAMVTEFLSSEGDAAPDAIPDSERAPLRLEAMKCR